MFVIGGEIGQVVKGGKVEKQYQKIDTDTLDFCWLHNITLTSDWKNPNEEDKKKLEKIRLIERESKGKDGDIIKFRMCPKCYLIVKYTNTK